MKTIPVFYCAEMSVDSGGYSPSASKPQQVVADWDSTGLAIDIRSFLPATAEELSTVHDSDHVLSILKGDSHNGHGNRIEEVSESCRWTVGSFVAAAKEAVSNGRVACSPTSGFHHAGYEYCGAFCTFNGLMATTPDGSRQAEVRLAISELESLKGNYHAGLEQISLAINAGSLPSQSLPEAYLQRSQLLYLEGRPQDAIRDLKSVLRMPMATHGHQGNAWLQLANCYEELRVHAPSLHKVCQLCTKPAACY